MTLRDIKFILKTYDKASGRGNARFRLVLLSQSFYMERTGVLATIELVIRRSKELSKFNQRLKSLIQ